jgi:hypothetical protein
MTRAYGDEHTAGRPVGIAFTPEQQGLLRRVRKAHDLLQQGDADDLAQVIDERLRGDVQRPVIVFVGEAKRGKSSLVNAVAGVTDLAPVGSDVTTARPLHVLLREPGDRSHGALVRFSVGPDHPIAASEVHRWITGHVDSTSDATVESVDVAVPADRLHGAVLVDTPGAGGLHGGHVRLALLSARRAGVLVLVTTAGQPLTRPELDFLQQAAEGVDRVVLAMTKVDVHAGVAPAVVAENRTLLRTHAPRLADAPIVEVSSAWALASGGASGPVPDAWEASGVPELITVLESAIGGLSELHVRNAVRTAVAALDRHVTVLDARIAAARQEPGVGDRAAAERDALTALRGQEARWTLDLDRDLGRVRSRTLTTLTDGANDLRDQWQSRLERERAGFRRSVAEETTADLQADLAELLDTVTGELAEGLQHVVADLLEREGADRVLEGSPAAVAGIRASRAPSGFTQVLDPGVLSTGMVGAGLGSALTGTITGGAAAGSAVGIGGLVAAALPIAVPVLVGASLIGLTTMYKQVQLARRRQSEWAVREIERTRQRATTHVQDTLSELKPEIVTAFRTSLTSRIADLQAVVQEVDTAMRRDTSARQQRVTALEMQRAAAVERRDELIASLTAGS